MALTDAEKTLYTSRLAEAEEALHQLNIGSALAELRDQNGEIVKYSPASRPALRAYIAELRIKLGLSCGPRPMQVWVR